MRNVFDVDTERLLNTGFIGTAVMSIIHNLLRLEDSTLSRYEPLFRERRALLSELASRRDWT